MGMKKGEDTKRIILEAGLDMAQGMGNLVMWRACDTLGNGPAQSQDHRIWVDSEGVVFGNATPGVDDISTTGNVTVEVEISDATSGVNASTVEYAVSADAEKNWGDWVAVAGLDSGPNLLASVDLTLSNGTANRVKFRANDIADNGPTESEPIIVNVNRNDVPHRTWAFDDSRTASTLRAEPASYALIVLCSAPW